MEENKSEAEAAGAPEGKSPEAETKKAEAASGADGRPSPEERYWALGAHLSGLVLSFLGPLVVWLVKKEESSFVEDQAKEALNFQILLFAAFLLSSTLLCVLGPFLIPALLLTEVAFCVIAAIKSNEGERYRYPSFLPRIIK